MAGARTPPDDSGMTLASGEASYVEVRTQPWQEAPADDSRSPSAPAELSHVEVASWRAPEPPPDDSGMTLASAEASYVEVRTQPWQEAPADDSRSPSAPAELSHVEVASWPSPEPPPDDSGMTLASGEASYVEVRTQPSPEPPPDASRLTPAPTAEVAHVEVPSRPSPEPPPDASRLTPAPTAEVAHVEVPSRPSPHAPADASHAHVPQVGSPTASAAAERTYAAVPTWPSPAAALHATPAQLPPDTSRITSVSRSTPPPPTEPRLGLSPADAPGESHSTTPGDVSRTSAVPDLEPATTPTAANARPPRHASAPLVTAAAHRLPIHAPGATLRRRAAATPEALAFARHVVADALRTPHAVSVPRQVSTLQSRGSAHPWPRSQDIVWAWPTHALEATAAERLAAEGSAWPGAGWPALPTPRSGISRQPAAPRAPWAGAIEAQTRGSSGTHARSASAPRVERGQAPGASEDIRAADTTTARYSAPQSSRWRLATGQRAAAWQGAATEANRPTADAPFESGDGYLDTRAAARGSDQILAPGEEAYAASEPWAADERATNMQAPDWAWRVDGQRAEPRHGTARATDGVAGDTPAAAGRRGCSLGLRDTACGCTLGHGTTREVHPRPPRRRMWLQPGPPRCGTRTHFGLPRRLVEVQPCPPGRLVKMHPGSAERRMQLRPGP